MLDPVRHILVDSLEIDKEEGHPPRRVNDPSFLRIKVMSLAVSVRAFIVDRLFRSIAFVPSAVFIVPAITTADERMERISTDVWPAPLSVKFSNPL